MPYALDSGNEHQHSHGEEEQHSTSLNFMTPGVAARLQRRCYGTVTAEIILPISGRNQKKKRGRCVYRISARTILTSRICFTFDLDFKEATVSDTSDSGESVTQASLFALS